LKVKGVSRQDPTILKDGKKKKKKKGIALTNEEGGNSTNG